jgi:hypothetical protein
MGPAARKAIENHLSYLRDNRYRYVKLGKLPIDHPTVVEHDREIAELEKELNKETNDNRDS